MEPPKNSIPVSLQAQLADLDFLSQIERNMKPCCNDRVLVNSESWSGALYRFFKGESRMTAITKVEQIVNNAIEAIENQKYQEHISLTINSLYNASNGLLNLSYTYENDPNMKARINVQIKNINIQLDRYKHLIKGFEERIESSSKNRHVIDMTGKDMTSKDRSVIDLMDSNSLDFDKKKMKRPFIKKTE